jgi:hypothetical protein
MDAGAVIAVFVVAAGIVPIVAWWRSPSRRARRLLARVAEQSLGAVGDGERVRVRGVAVRATGNLEAPFTRRKCLGFLAIVEEQRNGTWNEILRIEECLPFIVAIDGFEARVEGPFFVGLDIDARGDALSPPIRETIRAHGVTLSAWGWTLPLRFHESALEENDQIWVLGRASVVVDPRGQRQALRGLPIVRVFKGTAREPVVVADAHGATARQQGAGDASSSPE